MPVPRASKRRSSTSAASSPPRPSPPRSPSAPSSARPRVACSTRVRPHRGGHRPPLAPARAGRDPLRRGARRDHRPRARGGPRRRPGAGVPAAGERRRHPSGPSSTARGGCGAPAYGQRSSPTTHGSSATAGARCSRSTSCSSSSSTRARSACASPTPPSSRSRSTRLGVGDPARAVFLDDFEAHVLAARALGLRGVLVGPDPAPALAELDALLAGLDQAPMAAPGRPRSRRSSPARAGPSRSRVEDVLGEPLPVFKTRARSLRELLLRSARARREGVHRPRRAAHLATREHLALVASAAHALRDRYGVRPGDRVAILAENCPEWLIAFWATVRIGGVVAALNGWWQADEIRVRHRRQRAGAADRRPQAARAPRRPPTGRAGARDRVASSGAAGERPTPRSRGADRGGRPRRASSTRAARRGARRAPSTRTAASAASSAWGSFNGRT